MEKVIRNGKVAVIYSPGFGSGWSTWNIDHQEKLLFHPTLVDLVEKQAFDILSDEDQVKEIIGINSDEHLCCLSGAELKIEWVTQGRAFYIKEYDGYESVLFGDNDFVGA